MKIDNIGFLKNNFVKTENNNLKKELNNGVSKEKELLTFDKDTKNLSMILNEFKFEDTIRVEKLNKIRERIENGTFEITGKDVIKKIMGDK